jgi:hypothetical protein
MARHNTPFGGVSLDHISKADDATLARDEERMSEIDYMMIHDLNIQRLKGSPSAVY